jgi:hypothetical protein
MTEPVPKTKPAARAKPAPKKRPAEDPVLRALREAPIDDEPVTDEEQAAIEEGLDALELGDVISDEELRRRLGL